MNRLVNLARSLRQLLARTRPDHLPWKAVRSHGTWAVRNDLTTVTVGVRPDSREQAENVARQYNAAEASGGPYDLLPPAN
ncbi:hypothetical protein [Streptomyces syringium]|uniref:hypothetical protein n=1 Tax=Streptomyces syringium TaxID=76729 RepID=UPI003AAF6B58